MLLLSLDIRCGDEIVLRASGPQADRALDILAGIASAQQ